MKNFRQENIKATVKNDVDALIREAIHQVYRGVLELPPSGATHHVLGIVLLLQRLQELQVTAVDPFDGRAVDGIVAI